MSTLVLVHVVISLIAIVAGLVVMFKMLGSDREVNMWQPENISGGFFLNVPDDWKHLFGQAHAPKTDDTVIEIKSREDQ